MKILDNFTRKYKVGYTNDEVMQIFEGLINADEKIFFDCLNGVTATEIAGRILFYQIDIDNAIKCSIEKRNLKDYEWD